MFNGRNKTASTVTITICFPTDQDPNIQNIVSLTKTLAEDFFILLVHIKSSELKYSAKIAVLLRTIAFENVSVSFTKKIDSFELAKIENFSTK